MEFKGPFSSGDFAVLEAMPLSPVPAYPRHAVSPAPSAHLPPQSALPKSSWVITPPEGGVITHDNELCLLAGTGETGEVTRRAS
jgi:hypothetical protein